MGDDREQNAGQITDEDIEKQKSMIGLEEVNGHREFLTQLSTDSIRNFATSIGDDNPLYTDPAYARGTRWGGQIAPAIMTAITNEPIQGRRIPREKKREARRLFRGCQIFMSGGTWSWYRPMYPGDTIHSFEGVESCEVKESEFGGRTVHVIDRFVKLNQRGEVVGIYRALRIMAERKTAREKGKYQDIEPASYTPEEIAEIDAAYLEEAPRGGETRYWEDVEEGESVPSLRKGPLTMTDVILAHCAGYGFAPVPMLTSSRVAAKLRKRMPAFFSPNRHGAPDTEARVHWESESARKVGNPEAYDWGLQREFWLHHVLTDWIGDEGFVVSQRDEIRKFNYLGDLQVLSGEVVRKHEKDGRHFVDLSVLATNQRGVETAIAEATVALPSRSGGPVVLPQPPAELQAKATEFLAEHNRLAHGAAS